MPISCLLMLVIVVIMLRSKLIGFIYNKSCAGLAGRQVSESGEADF
ncbi:hypothetical protein CH64_1749 [Yersinia rohdei]|uniref:Uncharacterized protein n=1 Tax=Yersinia rohdei TaxID=29485 RepID=A0A0U1HWT5_YERRO|nr:hypothetical protein CH64_1749 [Yersinia rohdei]EEQ01520.1 hypothetical protein yrohd0001_19600 [Yersinia rohdei ATCC 43380]CQI95802.1 Uncharacterised protein [Yersinia rohdei]